MTNLAPELRYLFFLGCTIPYRVLSYEVSARKIAEKLGLRLVEMPEFNCCGLPIDPINHEMMLALSARNLCLAEQQGLPIMTLCNGCAGTLRKVNRTLKGDKEVRARVNGYLKEIGMEFKGTTEVKHFIQVLAEDVGLERIRSIVKKPFENLKVAQHYGCHLLRPSKEIGFDDPEDPRVLKELIELTGARCLDYTDETQCCGATVSGINSEIPLQLVREKLQHIKEAGAQALITICPSCHLMFDFNQARIERLFGEKFDIPVLHYPQLLALAADIDTSELALEEHKVNVLEKISLFC